ncbi:hypothetical protein PANO111632_02805 [Paracoccus nototheniae]|uniref:Uncharacterized protein n=1 Tax=Paracoccus nototheniae TaxID=2489002 RepID=A0ABW4DVI5_9RHOB|nr:hypothetical protein [Paracoccus nototheniae]
MTHDEKKKVQDLTERFTARELAAAYIKASRRAKDAERKLQKAQKENIDMRIKGWARSMGGLSL